MYPMYSHPATKFVCRHCKGDAGYDPDLFYQCGPLCAKCWAAEVYPCQAKSANPPSPHKFDSATHTALCDAARVYSGECSCGEDDYTNDNERIS